MKINTLFKTCPTNCADRVNLGLIPSSENSWETACKALKSESGGHLHIHGNVDVKDQTLTNGSKESWILWSSYTRNKIENIFQNLYLTKWFISVEHIEFVKSYAPKVDHIVLDIKCKPL